MPGASCSATSCGWSVTTVLKICTCSSSSSNLSPAAARTASIFSSTASAAVVAIDAGLMLRPTIFGLIPTMSASCAARARIFGPPPPIMIGMRRVRLRHGVDLGDLVVRAREGERAVGPQTLHDLNRLAEPGDACQRVVLVDAGDGVVLLRPAGADPERETPLAEQIDGGALLGEQHRVAEVDPGDVGTDQDRGRGVGRGHQRRHDGELVAEVVVHVEALVAEVLGLADGVGPLLGRAGLDGLGSEAKRARMCGHVNSPSVRSAGGAGRGRHRPSCTAADRRRTPRR